LKKKIKFYRLWTLLKEYEYNCGIRGQIMLLLDSEKKQIIEELQDIIDELDLIDFLRKYFHNEYATIFDKEVEEKILIGKEKLHFGNSHVDKFDIRRYSLFLLKNYISKEININNYYTSLDILKVVIFYEHIIKMLDASNVDDNNRIREALSVYHFYKILISDTICQLSKFDDAIKALGFQGLTQKSLDDDKFRSMHDFISKLVLDNYLTVFIDDYKNYL
jgi:hypothetical protein